MGSESVALRLVRPLDQRDGGTALPLSHSAPQMPLMLDAFSPAFSV